MTTTRSASESESGAGTGAGIRAGARPGGAPNAVWLVAEREITMRLRSKAFLISTGILLLAVLASIVIGGLLSNSPSLSPVAVVGSAASAVPDASGLEAIVATSQAEAEQLVRDGTVDAAIVPDAASPTGMTVIGLDSPPSAVIAQLSVAPTVEILEPSTQNPFLIYLVALGFGLVFFMSAMTFGSTIAQSVVEEKQTRVVEILLSTVSARTLMAGKVLGNSIMAFAQIAVIAALSMVGMMITGQDQLLGDLGASLIWFVVFFAFGFVLIAALYAATAALVSRQEDVASATSPVMMLVMLPYFLVIIFNNNPTVLAVMSYVPFSAPVGMPMRLFLGTAAWWEPLLSLVILLATTLVVIMVGSRIYSNSLLRTGARVKLSEALKS